MLVTARCPHFAAEGDGALSQHDARGRCRHSSWNNRAALGLRL